MTALFSRTARLTWWNGSAPHPPTLLTPSLSRFCPTNSDATLVPVHDLPSSIIDLGGSFRVHAENVLGAGAPSKPVEVNLGAFLGHLRAQHGRKKASAPSHGQEEQYLLETVSPARGPDIPCPSDANTDISLPSKRHVNLTRDPEAQQEAERGETFDDGITPNSAPGNDTEGAKTPYPQDHSSGKHAPLAPDVLSPRVGAAFGDDFMGLGSFGEPRVHNLFAPPSPSPRRCDRRARLRAPATGGALGTGYRSLCGVGAHDGGRENGPYPLPPIVLASGISGDTRQITPITELPGSFGRGQSCHGGGSWGNVHRGGVPDARRAEDPRDLECRKSRTRDGTANTNEVFHAFINLGRRLPRRIPRDREQKGREPR